MSFFEDTPGFNMLYSFLNPQSSYEAAEKGMKGYLEPFYQGGRDQYPRLNEATGRLLNPADLENEWIKGYQMSPYARQQIEQNRTAGLDAASSMGLNGSSAAIGNIQQGAANIANQDRQQYLNDLMQKYMTGIGLGQNLYGTGANVGTQLGENTAQLEYGRRAAPGKLFGQLAGTAFNNYGNTGNIFNPGKSNYNLLFGGV